jgi:hypothetical protein
MLITVGIKSLIAFMITDLAKNPSIMPDQNALIYNLRYVTF